MKRSFLILLMAYALNSCSGAKLKPSQTYSFDSASWEGPVNSQTEMTLGLGPVELADYLDRPQLVRRDPQGRLLIHHRHRWGRDLKDFITEDLASALQDKEPQWKIRMHPWYRSSQIDYQVLVSIDEFEPFHEEKIVLRGKISFVPYKKAGEGREEEFRFESSMKDDSFSAQVETMQKLNSALAQKVYRVISETIDPSRLDSKPVSDRDLH